MYEAKVHTGHSLQGQLHCRSKPLLLRHIKVLNSRETITTHENAFSRQARFQIDPFAPGLSFQIRAVFIAMWLRK